MNQSFLRREAYIRYAGILLTLSPVGNFLWSSAISGLNQWYRPHILWIILKSVSPLLWFLWGSAFAAGVQMLKGKRSSWTFTLWIIGMNIVFGIITFKRDMHLGWVQPAVSLMINLGLFTLIYTQEFHQRLERKLRQSLNRPFVLHVNSGPVVHFDGAAPWARVTEITNTGIRLKSVDGNAPRDIESRMIELALTRELLIKARFEAKAGSDYVFRFVGMNTIGLALLTRWARKVAQRSTEKMAA